MEFQENEFDPKNETLIDLRNKLHKKSLSFHPYLAMQAINQEVENQLRETIVNHFKGMSIDALGACNVEIKEYADAEEERYQAFQKAKELDPNAVLKMEPTSSQNSNSVTTLSVDKTKKSK